MFKPIGSLIREIPTRSKTPKAILALQVRQAVMDCIKKECSDLPEEIIKSIKPSTFKNNILTLITPTLVSSELHARSEGLIKEINKALGRKIVSRLRFRVL